MLRPRPLTNAGSSLVLRRRGCAGWVNFNGTLTGPISPRAGFNVTSITDNGAGDQTVIWDRPFTATGYAVFGATITSNQYFSISSAGVSQSAGATRLIENPAADQSVVTAIAFGT